MTPCGGTPFSPTELAIHRLCDRRKKFVSEFYALSPRERVETLAYEDRRARHIQEAIDQIFSGEKPVAEVITARLLTLILMDG